MCIGIALELMGFGCVAVGLWQTWQANADGRPFFHRRIRQAARWVLVNAFRRKPKSVAGSGFAVGARLTMGAAAGYASLGLTDEMTVDAKIAAVQANALRALADAASAQEAVGREQRAREKAVAELESQIAGAEQSLTSFARGLIVHGVPLTVAGLVCAIAGSLLQAAASIATFYLVS